MKPTILAKVVEDSISLAGVRFTTVQVRFPRIVHSELMTHRALSKNAGSSRAKPIAKMLAEVFKTPACPVEWGSNQPGMQAGAQLTGWRLWAAKATWLSAARMAAAHSWILMKLGAAKQIANRVTEPFQHIDVLISGTDWDNFDILRCHPDADPTMRDLAIEIMVAIELSVPRVLRGGEWHLPYVLDHERATLQLQDQIKVSVARCARISYTPFDGNPSIEKERERYAKLVGAQPIHASPTEHQATPAIGANQRFGNLRGWKQHRQEVEATLPPHSGPRLRRDLTDEELNRFFKQPLSERQKDGLRAHMDAKMDAGFRNEVYAREEA
jgi:hypothetical protein